MAAGSGFIIEAWGWAAFFGVTMALAIPALFLLALVRNPEPR